ncbi:MAG: heme biosynthesis protein HemY [Acinetobacter sp.]|nr:heme biosynthesis protein HemY [Acinetobacter sp.]
MKQIIMVYALLALLLFALMSVLSYGVGGGYVYVLWHGVQLQTNLWVIVFAGLLLSFLIKMSSIVLKRYLKQEKRKIQHITHFKDLHSYEQLGVLWLLGAEAQEERYIQPTFGNSGLLNQTIQANLLIKKNQPSDALKTLEDSPADAFELAELQRIKAYLTQKDGEQALTHLEFLNGHQLSPWLIDLKHSYEQKLIQLWGVFAVQFPWIYLKSTQHGHLEAVAKYEWLSQLLKDVEQASESDLDLLKKRYLEQQDYIQSLNFETKILWLKLLSRFPDMAEQHGDLAIKLLDERFDQEVFYLWFQQQLLKQNPDFSLVEKQINDLDVKYPSMPILSFALWHVYIATEREQEASHLLELYPDNIMMNYLRIKSTLNGDELLIQQLNSVFEKDSNFIQVKI